MISLIFSIAMIVPINSPVNIPSNCTNAAVTVVQAKDVSTRTSLVDPFVFFEAEDFRFTLGREDTFKLLKERVDNAGKDDLQVRVLVFLINSLPVKDNPNDIAEIWPDHSQLKGNQRLLAENLEHEIVTLFLRALREGSAIVERTGNNKQVSHLNVQMYEAPNVEGVRFVTTNQSAFDYCQLTAD